jgi:hypothetical protein
VGSCRLAAVERKSLDNLAATLSDGTLAFQMQRLAELPLAANGTATTKLAFALTTLSERSSRAVTVHDRQLPSARRRLCAASFAATTGGTWSTA